MYTIKDDLLDFNQFSRQGAKLDKVMAIVVHYIGNPGATAKQVRDYWDSLKSQDVANDKSVSASAHFIVDFDGSVLRAIPEDEKAYHCGAVQYSDKAIAFFVDYTSIHSSPNRVSIGVEMCHPDFTGQPNPNTLLTTLELVGDLCARYSLDPETNVFRHFDITGKNCPKWFVNNPNKWQDFWTP
jgi:N-acetylmuramoyl-L-alanine amidase